MAAAVGSWVERRARVVVREAEHGGMPLDLGRLTVKLQYDGKVVAWDRRGEVRAGQVVASEGTRERSYRLTVEGGDVWVVTPGCGCG